MKPAGQSPAPSALTVRPQGLRCQEAIMKPGRVYTVEEIDEMRRIVRDIQHTGGATYDTLDARTEDMLRTYMWNGVTVEQLNAALQKKRGII